MMTEMTRYKQQTNYDDDSSVTSVRTEDLSVGPTRVKYHMGSNCWRNRTFLEKWLTVVSSACFVVIFVLVIVLQTRPQPGPSVHLHGMHLHQEHRTECRTRECIMIAGDILRNMDPEIDPCNDFYQYACGGWIARNSLPPGKPEWGTLLKLASDTQLVLRNVLESNKKTVSKAEEMAKQFYASCIDANNTVETLGAKPLLDLIDKAGGWQISRNWSSSNYNLQKDVTRTLINFSSGGLFSWWVAEDNKNSSRNVLIFDQGGLFFRGKEYYFNETEKKLIDAYVKHITEIGVLLGADKSLSKRVAESILDVEKGIANFTVPVDQRRDDEKLYHSMTLSDLTSIAPFINWTDFVKVAFKQINKSVKMNMEVVVYGKDFLISLSKYIKNLTSTNKGITALHNYLTWHFVINHIPYLSKAFRESYRDLQKVQVGTVGSQEAWRECVDTTDARFGLALGAMYVRANFQNKSISDVDIMLREISDSFRHNIINLDWMDKVTKKAALDKLDHISKMIGYPEFILNPDKLDEKFTDLSIDKDRYFENNVVLTKFRVKENLRKLDKAVNRTHWDMSPSTVNAYYSTTRNNIFLPAGILQPPLFTNTKLWSLNFGMIGVVIGHELAHAFDDEGRKYDFEGNLRQWWENSTTKSFQEHSKCMVDQYSEYSVLEEHVKGNRTLGENIADNGGLKASYDAFLFYENSLSEHKTLPGLNLNPHQLFFLGFAQVWCSTMTKEAIHLEIREDPHVLGQFRVLGSLSNSEAFAKEFNCPKNSRMNPEKKCSLW